jgi:hypothetical protein
LPLPLPLVDSAALSKLEVATSLNNPARLYHRKNATVKPLYPRGLAILLNSLGETHPNTQTGWRNFLYFLRRVIQAGQTAQLSNHLRTQGAIERLMQG